MARILVLYYSSYGHTAQMAEAVAEGVREAGHQCEIRRVPIFITIRELRNDPIAIVLATAANTKVSNSGRPNTTSMICCTEPMKPNMLPESSAIASV